MVNRLWSLIKEIHYDQRGGTGTAVATGDTITATKMNLKLEDYDLIDDQELIFGTGDDVKVTFDGTKLLITIASQLDFILTGGHWCMQTLEDTKNIRLNSRDYVATSGDVCAVQTKPNISVGGTTGVTGIESMPRFASGIAGSKLVGIMSNPILKGAAGGNLSSAMRCYEGKLESDSGSTRTVAEAYVLHAMQALHGTVTDGPYVLAVDAAGGNVEWAGLMKLVDNGGAIADLASAVTTVVGAIKVKIGAQVGYIPVYTSYTAS